MKSLAVVAFAVLILAVAVAAVSAQKRQAAEAVERMGFHDAELHASLLVFCAKGRVGWQWRSPTAHGQVCAGGFLPPSVSVWP